MKWVRNRSGRSRVFARLLVLNLVLFFSPLLPGWAALASQGSGTRLVKLCTGKGLRLVAVPVEEAVGLAHGGEEEKPSGFTCSACPLGKCSSAGTGFAPVMAALIDTAAAGGDSSFASADPAPATPPLERGPPSRAPPAA
jgi:hypothetical protein